MRLHNFLENNAIGDTMCNIEYNKMIIESNSAKISRATKKLTDALRVPSKINKKTAQQIADNLREYEQNVHGHDPNTWHTMGGHLDWVAKISYTLASQMPGGTFTESPMHIYNAGKLHDVAKTEEGRAQIHHGILGYNVFKDIDPFVAHVCMTHMFINNEPLTFEESANEFFGERWQYNMVVDYLSKNPATNETKIINLADSLGAWQGPVDLETRRRDIETRRPMPKWETREVILKHFNNILANAGKPDVYRLLCVNDGRE